MSEDCRGIPSQPVFVLSPYCCVLSGEATNTNFIVVGLTRPGLEPRIYCTLGKRANHYTTDAVRTKLILSNYFSCLKEIIH